MRRDLLDRLIDLKEQRRSVAHLRWLESGREALMVDGRIEDILSHAPADLTAADLQAIEHALARDEGGVVMSDTGPLFIHIFQAPLRLTVIGAVHIAQSLAPMASLAGYDVTVVDPRAAFATNSRFPGTDIVHDWPDDALEARPPDHRTAIVALTHDPKIDDPGLDAALRSKAFYIAALGSKKTHQSRLERLSVLGHEPASLARIHGPAGLAIGAVSPAEIALSIMAEMTATLRLGERS